MAYNLNKYNDNILDKKHIQKYIINKLLKVDKYHNYLITLLERKYNDKDFKSGNYFKEYYCINSDWMNNYLELYNYEKIKRTYERIDNRDIILEDEIYKMFKEKRILAQPGEKDKRINLLDSINFKVKEDNIPTSVYVDYYSEKAIKYFDDFVLLSKELYDEIKQDYKNPIFPYYNNFHREEKIVNICLVDNIFIYKINDNILGIGILDSSSNKFPILNNQFFIIMNKECPNCNLKTEINLLFASKNLETYLAKYRSVTISKNDHFKKIDMMNKKEKIGMIYNIEFDFEKYKERNVNICIKIWLNELISKNNKQELDERLKYIERKKYRNIIKPFNKNNNILPPLTLRYSTNLMDKEKDRDNGKNILKLSQNGILKNISSKSVNLPKIMKTEIFNRTISVLKNPSNIKIELPNIYGNNNKYNQRDDIKDKEVDIEELLKKSKIINDTNNEDSKEEKDYNEEKDKKEEKDNIHGNDEEKK